MAVHLILSLAAKVLCCTLWGLRINRGIVRSWDNAALQSCWINHSPVVVIHPFIQAASLLWLLLLPNCMSLLPSVTPRALQSQWGHDSLEWLEKMSQRPQYCPVSAHVTLTQGHKMEGEGETGDWSSEGNAPRRNSIRLSVWDTEIRCTAFSLTSFTSYRLTFLPMSVLYCICVSLANLTFVDI